MKMRLSRLAIEFAAATAVLLSLGCPVLEAQSALSGSGVADDPEFFVTLDAYVKYGGDIDVIDGLTGNIYHSDNAVVKTIHSNFPKIMGGLHGKLLELEAKYMNFYLEQGVHHERELIELAESFGITNFQMDRSNWMVREKAILRRLSQEPFFQIKELVVWEKEEMGRSLPDNKWARNIRFNEETDSWERRVLTDWRVNVPTQWRLVQVHKRQGLNLESNQGFHIIDYGLPTQVQASNFKEVSVSYPIIVSRREDSQAQIDRIQHEIVENLSHLYDPFTWVARRSTRFRVAFSAGLLKYFEERKYRVKDRDWFNPVICHFLNDVVVVKRYGFEEVYDLYVDQQFGNSKNVLGEDLDLLNWHSDEKRQGEGVNPNKKIYLSYDNRSSARFVLLDAYLRYGDRFLDALRARLTNLKKREVAKDLIRDVIAEVSGVSADKYIPAAIEAQKMGIEAYRKTVGK